MSICLQLRYNPYRISAKGIQVLEYMWIYVHHLNLINATMGFHINRVFFHLKTWFTFMYSETDH